VLKGQNIGCGVVVVKVWLLHRVFRQAILFKMDPLSAETAFFPSLRTRLRLEGAATASTSRVGADPACVSVSIIGGTWSVVVRMLRIVGCGS
jgi:hypothetical protein